MPNNSREKKIVIVGGGFGGIFTAIYLDKLLRRRSLSADILLLDRNNYHLFTPLLHEVAGGAVEPRHVVYPIRKIGRGKKFTFCRAEVLHIDFEGKTLFTDIGEFNFDILVLATGGTTNFYDVKGADRFCFRFKTISHAINLRNHVLDLIEQASCISKSAKRERMLTFIVIGGGCSGLELTSELFTFLNFLVKHDYQEIKSTEIKFHLLEAGECLITTMPRPLGDKARQRLQKMGIDVKLESPVNEVAPGKVYYGNNESIESETIVWSGGIKSGTLASKLPFIKDKMGRIKTDDYLHPQDQDDTFLLGDMAYVIDSGSGLPLPPTAQVAIQEARSVAHNIVRILTGQAAIPFTFRYKGDLVSLGNGYGVAEIYGVSFSGFPAWLAWKLYYLNNLIGIRNKLRITFDWVIASLFEPDTARIDITTKKKDEVLSKL